ncbi:MAG: SHOCT domain-containing protein [Candidatus Aminicenantes bacterium]|nr:SHOCT domain-containing protein [Candidatus Aminicenantes bacterium]
MMSGNYGFMGGGFMWIFWILVIVGLVFLIKWIVQSNKLAESGIGDSSLEILKRRYVQGEIDKQEFEQKKKDLLS